MVPPLLIFLAAQSLMGCGTDVVEQVFTVEMYGVYVDAADATGDLPPVSHTYTLEGVTITNAETGEGLSLFGGAATEYIISSRPQIIFKKDISELEEVTFSNAAIQFNAAAKGAGKIKSNHTFTIDEPLFIVEQSFTVEKGKGIRVTIKVQWGKTVTRNLLTQSETMEAPSYDLSLEAS